MKGNRYGEMQWLPLELRRRRRIAGVRHGIHCRAIQPTITAGTNNMDIADLSIEVVKPHFDGTGRTGQERLTRVNLGGIDRRTKF